MPVSADRPWLEEMLSGKTLKVTPCSSPGCVTPTLLPQPSELPLIQELAGQGLWSACTQEWIAGIEGHVFLASIMARGRHPHSGWHAALRWVAWILLAGLREKREVLSSVQHCYVTHSPSTLPRSVCVCECKEPVCICVKGA